MNSPKPRMGLIKKLITYKHRLGWSALMVRCMIKKLIAYKNRSGWRALIVRCMAELIGHKTKTGANGFAFEDIAGRLASFSKDRKTVLVVSHEASLTGAPVLSLNIVQQLAQRYNVVAMLLGDGAISNAFGVGGAVVVNAFAARGNPQGAGYIIAALTQWVTLEFAVVNSIVSYPVLPALAKAGIPTIHLIHEFAAYTRPKTDFWNSLFWPTERVFSTAITLESAHTEFPSYIADESSMSIIPQGRCALPQLASTTQNIAQEHARLKHALRPAGNADRAFIVLGAGSVQYRKGVDLFIQCAARVLDLVGADRVRFVWMGGGFNPEQDVAYSVYLADQIRRARLQGEVEFLDETSAIETAYKEADALLLSSRLDPLPNVAIDAMAHGLPVLCFEKTTGIAEILVDADLGNACVAKYLDVEDIAGKITALINSKALHENISKRSLALAAERFDMPTYISALENRAAAACQRMQQEQRDVADIQHAGVMQLDFAFPPRMADAMPEDPAAYYVRSWAAGIDRRKPLPGFHPGIYKARHGLRVASADPFADYLREGSPRGPWRIEVITETSPLPAADTDTAMMPAPRIAVHLHAFYPELVGEFVERLALNTLRADLFISVPDEDARTLVLAQLNNYNGRVCDVKVTPNRGRDIGPLFTAFGAALVQNYDIVGHFHTKASKAWFRENDVGQIWYQFILENLLGGKGGKMADRILYAMAADSSLGLVFPDDPNIVGWTRNREPAHDLAARLGIGKSLPDQFNFPVGTMFWAKTAVLKPLVDMGLAWNDYPEEPLAYDGTMLHAIERLIPIVAENSGLAYRVTNVAGVSR